MKQVYRYGLAALFITGAAGLYLHAFNDMADKGAEHHANLHTSHLSNLQVFKSPTCGCCTSWIKHLEHSAFSVNYENVIDTAQVKNRYGIAQKYRSCHTAVSADGYAFEGHVPAKFIRQFLTEKPANAIGLAVPAMPIGSPGMEVGSDFTPYQVVLLMKDGSSRVYADIQDYKTQF